MVIRSLILATLLASCSSNQPLKATEQSESDFWLETKVNIKTGEIKTTKIMKPLVVCADGRKVHNVLKCPVLASNQQLVCDDPDMKKITFRSDFNEFNRERRTDFKTGKQHVGCRLLGK